MSDKNQHKIGKIIETSELYSLHWGLLAISIDRDKDDNINKELRLCIYALTTIIANNILATIKLDIIPYNLWGEYITRIGDILGHLNDLLFYTSTYFYYILNKEYILNLIKKDFSGKINFWNDASFLHFMAEILYFEYKEVEE